MKPPGVLSALRSRVRRLQLTLGLGMFAAALGGVVAAPVAAALFPWSQGEHALWRVAVTHTLVSRLWVYLVLPALWFGVARILTEARPWRLAVGSVVCGELCYLVLDWLSGSLTNIVLQPLLWAPRLVTLAVGTYLSKRAIEAGRR